MVIPSSSAIWRSSAEDSGDFLLAMRERGEDYRDYGVTEERLRFTVRPGITGWAQIHGRANVPWSERLALDVWYVRNRSFALDLRILASTALKTLRRENIVAVPGRVTFDLDEERRRAAE